MGAGILPVTVFKGTIFFLLGKEYKNNYWCDFGGSSNNFESTFKTAIREGYEELDGFLGDKKELENRVYNNLIKQCFTKRYTTFLFNVDYEEINNLPYYFNNHRNFINRELTYEKKEGLFEKSEVKLFTKKELIRDINDIRPFYREIIPRLIEIELDEINNLNNLNNDIDQLIKVNEVTK